MLLRLLPTVALLALSTSQKIPPDTKAESKPNEEPKPAVLLASPLSDSQKQEEGNIPSEIRQFYARQQYAPELYGLTYFQPQYQSEAALPRLQPQIVLYGPGGQGQPILINPGNPPGNFLVPQSPGPNVILRNNPQGPVFPVAGYPKPAHIPPIEKDAEEIPTNPDNIPPLQSGGKPRAKPEKLETFTEPNQSDQNLNGNEGQLPQSVSLRPGQRFFVLNGDNIYNYGFEAQPDVQSGLAGFRYTNAQPFPQNPPKFLEPFAQEPPQFLQSGEERTPQLPMPNFLLRNSFVSSRQPEQPQLSQSQPNAQKLDKNGKEDAVKTAQQYFRTGLPLNQPQLLEHPQDYNQDYFVDQQGGIIGQPLNRQIQGPEGVQELPSKDEVIQPQLVGQFRFTPNPAPGFYQYRDDLENDAIVVDASFDAPSNFDGRGESIRVQESASGPPNSQPAEKEPEPSMAQAGPQATAIAGIGGVAGSAPRGTAIVGKGGLAVSSPQATAVAGTKDDDKKKRPVKKDK